MSRCHISVLQYQLDPIKHWSDFERKLEHELSQVKDSGADLVMLPEYAGLEIAYDQGKLPLAEFSTVNKFHAQYLQFFTAMAQKYQLYILPGTLPFKIRDRVYRNRAYFFTPEGRYFHQDKCYFTRFEKALGIFQRAEHLQVIHTSFAKVAIAVCYDVEFPLLVQRLAQTGVELLLVPSCTETLHGYYRVHLSCRARAIENQIYVANSCLIGEYPWSGTVDLNVGAAGVYTPIDYPYSGDGILAMGQLNQAMRVNTVLNFADLKECREKGAVNNFEDAKEPMDWAVQIG